MTDVARRPAGIVGACVSVPAGTTSTAAKFQRSVVGAVSLSVTLVPAAGVAAFCRWTQKVSPAGARYSLTFVWLLPTVRATARSQSLPAPHTHEPGRVVVSETLGAPVAALAPAVAPVAAVSAPLKLTTVIDP